MTAAQIQARRALIEADPRFVALMNLAIDSVAPRLSRKEYAEWLTWASSWKAGERSPQACVDIAHKCFAQKDDPAWHTLGQLAWAAKECCYTAPESGWLVIRYIADAMIAFGVAFPDKLMRLLPLESRENDE